MRETAKMKPKYRRFTQWAFALKKQSNRATAHRRIASNGNDIIIAPCATQEARGKRRERSENMSVTILRSFKNRKEKL
ncbi:MAG: hypothetical protein FWB96_02235 [Defluviitaleaceae bacterium]|nr:hypothetical protein [Defluviitaleaceae bacterium]MCL2262356.1 hypothetical protein [Defluviitaleaceae bacterium]